MRLTFPNGEHAAVHIEQGQIGVGSAAGGGTTVTIGGLSPLHAVFAVGRRGKWLTVPEDATVVVNARPIKRIAYLRAGDLVCLGSVQVRIEADEPPTAALDSVPGSRQHGEDASGPKAVLRGLSGAWFGRSVAISSPRVFGCGAGSDIRLDGAGVHDRHAIVDIEAGRVVVRLSANAAGLRVNGHSLRSAVLAPGDQLELGEHRFAVEAPGQVMKGDASRSGVWIAGDAPSDAPSKVGIPQVAMPTEPARRDPSGVYLLVAAAAALAAALTVFFVYAPRG